MNKKTTAKVLVSCFLGIVICGILFVIPMQKSQGDQYPDSISEVSYGFPLSFKTAASGGIAGNIKQPDEISLINLLLDLALFSAVSFVLISAFSLKSKK